VRGWSRTTGAKSSKDEREREHAEDDRSVPAEKEMGGRRGWFLRQETGRLRQRAGGERGATEAAVGSRSGRDLELQELIWEQYAVGGAEDRVGRAVWDLWRFRHNSPDGRSRPGGRGEAGLDRGRPGCYHVNLEERRNRCVCVCTRGSRPMRRISRPRCIRSASGCRRLSLRRTAGVSSPTRKIARPAGPPGGAPACA
jgi:hypothetical protein